MNVTLTAYTFNAAAKQITFTGRASVDLRRFTIIVNQGVVIFDVADPTRGGTVVGNVLTLAYDTAAMNNADPLVIVYDDDTASMPVSAASLPLPAGAAQDTSILSLLGLWFRALLQAVVNPPWLDKSANAIRNQVQSGTITTVTTVTTVSTVTNMSQIDTYQGKLLMVGQNVAAWAVAQRARIS